MFFKLSVQTYQPLSVIYRIQNFVYHHWGITSIYRLFSYPFIPGIERQQDGINSLGRKVNNSFIASYHRQLSADSKMKKFKIKISFISPEGPKARAKKHDLILCF